MKLYLTKPAINFETFPGSATPKDMKPISFSDIKNTLSSYFDTDISKDDILSAIEELKQRYADEAFAFEILEIAGGYQFMTKGSYHPIVGQFLRIESKRKLSRAALETLAIISYKQPITKSQMESIRGVNCDYTVQKLLDMELVEIVGREQGPGRPLLYGTTEKFMDHFGLKDLRELPQLKEFETEVEAIGLIEEE